jgi:hypothetical protein
MFYNLGEYGARLHNVGVLLPAVLCELCCSDALRLIRVAKLLGRLDVNCSGCYLQLDTSNEFDQLEAIRCFSEALMEYPASEMPS